MLAFHPNPQNILLNALVMKTVLDLQQNNFIKFKGIDTWIRRMYNGEGEVFEAI